MKFLILFTLFNLAFAETTLDEKSTAEIAEPKKEELQTEKVELVKETESEKTALETEPEKALVENEPKAESAESAVSEKPVVKEESKVEPETSETESVSNVDEAKTEASASSGVKYVCDEGRSYTLYEPGNDSNHLCELDAGHTEQPADWYALHDANFCKGKIEELISLYNCTQETQ